MSFIASMFFQAEVNEFHSFYSYLLACFAWNLCSGFKISYQRISLHFLTESTLKETYNGEQFLPWL